MQTSSGEWVVAAVVGLALFGMLAGSIYTTSRWQDTAGTAPTAASSNSSTPAANSQTLAQNSPTSVQIGLALLGIPPQDTDRRDPANISYLFPFEIVSVHFLVVLIGAAYLARAKRRRAPAS
jgi:NADH:ubiquinone oxidoreductase subunit 6 (subunit J)